MANLGTVFNSSNVEEFSNTIPEGEYLAHITKSELKENKKQTGSYLNFTFKIIDGEHKDFTLYDLMNIIHTNPRAQAMGQRKLVELQNACGLPDGVEDTVELHGIPVVVNVVTKPASDGYPEKSEIKGYASEDQYVPE